MTTQEAIETLKLMQAQVEWDYPMEYAAAVDMAVEALQKQIPKPIKITTFTKRCGNCGRQLSRIGNIHNIHPERNYCVKCGQKVGWDKF